MNDQQTPPEPAGAAREASAPTPSDLFHLRNSGDVAPCDAASTPSQLEAVVE